MIDRTEIEKLIAEAREDDARMTPAGWTCIGGASIWTGHGRVMINRSSDLEGLTRTRNNLPVMANALTQVLAEVDELREMQAADDELIESLTTERSATRTESARFQAMVDQLATARDVARVKVERLTTELSAMRPVVEAAEEMSNDDMKLTRTMSEALQAYRERTGTP
jgi:outer membrane murein-binding lipoprotein Lpp